MTPRSHILDDGGEGVLDTNLTGAREPDRNRGEGDFVIDLDLDPEPGGDFDLGLDFDEAGPGQFGPFDFDLAVIEAGPGGFDSTDDCLDLDDDSCVIIVRLAAILPEHFSVFED